MKDLSLMRHAFALAAMAILLSNCQSKKTLLESKDDSSTAEFAGTGGYHYIMGASEGLFTYGGDFDTIILIDTTMSTGTEEIAITGAPEIVFASSDLVSLEIPIYMEINIGVLWAPQPISD